jgi:hypothetical protein
MKERRPQFSEDEREAIADVARKVARVGESCVDTLVSAKIFLMKMTISAGTTGVLIDGRFISPTEMRHEVDVIGEVISQARIILQVEGRDTMSELDQHSQEAGWGSVFDHDSKISKIMNGLLPNSFTSDNGIDE